MSHKYSIRSLVALRICFLVAAAMIVFCGCTVKLVSSYDEITDQAITQLQKDFERFFLTMEDQAGAPKCRYENHKKFYLDSAVSISAISVRANALENNEITVKQVQLLKDSLDSLEKLHKMGCFTGGQVVNLKENFNTSITAILKLELAKKRGE